MSAEGEDIDQRRKGLRIQIGEKSATTRVLEREIPFPNHRWNVLSEINLIQCEIDGSKRTVAPCALWRSLRQLIF